MAGEADLLWVLVIAASALAGWWISVRPGSSYRGAAAGMSGLIITMAILMCLLAIQGQSPSRSGPSGFLRAASASDSSRR